MDGARRMWAILGWIWLGCTVVMVVLLAACCRDYETHGRTAPDQEIYERSRHPTP